MKLTSVEQQICDKFKQSDSDGNVHCRECPLAIDTFACICYANIDGRTTEAKALKRYKEDYDG